jgi:hypothetical protein
LDEKWNAKVPDYFQEELLKFAFIPRMVAQR